MRDLNYLDDAPERRMDRLWPGMTAFASRLAALASDLPSEVPLLLHGEWGSGKTTALRAMCSLMNDQAHGRPVVWFDAWRHEHGAGLAAGLARAIWRGAALGWRNDEAGKNALDALWTESQVVSGLQPAQPGPGDSSQRLRDALLRTFKEWPGKPLIIVDGLDRCAPAAVAGFFDALRVMTESNPTEGSYLIAGDRAILTAAMATKFKDVEHFSADDAFEQLFPISLSVPRIDMAGVQQLVHFYLLRIGAGPLKDEHRDALGRTFTAPCFQCPRLLKRCMNRLCLLLELEGEQEFSPKQIDRDRALIEWLAAIARWPVLREWMRSAQQSDWEELRRILGQPPTTLHDRRLMALVSDHESIGWLATQMFRPRGDKILVFKDAEQRLMKVGL